jgi:hypothetical protein
MVSRAVANSKEAIGRRSVIHGVHAERYQGHLLGFRCVCISNEYCWNLWWNLQNSRLRPVECRLVAQIQDASFGPRRSFVLAGARSICNIWQTWPNIVKQPKGGHGDGTSPEIYAAFDLR